MRGCQKVSHLSSKYFQVAIVSFVVDVSGLVVGDVGNWTLVCEEPALPKQKMLCNRCECVKESEREASYSFIRAGSGL